MKRRVTTVLVLGVLATGCALVAGCKSYGGSDPGTGTGQTDPEKSDPGSTSGGTEPERVTPGR